jgi:hypothetical protein
MALTVATLLEKCSKSNRISQILKKFACGEQFSILSSELNGFQAFTVATLLEKCSKSDRIYRKSSKKIACGEQFSILSSELNGFHHCYIAGKVLQIRLKITNPQKNSPAAGSSVYFPQN